VVARRNAGGFSSDVAAGSKLAAAADEGDADTGVAEQDDGAAGGESPRLATGERAARPGASRFAGSAWIILGLNVPRDDIVYRGKRSFSPLMVSSRRRKFKLDESPLWSLWRPAMREIHASQARIPLRRRRDEAERGETAATPRRGRAVARIAPDARRWQEQVETAIETIKALRRRAGTIALDELVSARREGRNS
jgi:antitoxin (DNA-binding transcriptional repressor) of toxin-antitoxin stability system